MTTKTMKNISQIKVHTTTKKSGKTFLELATPHMVDGGKENENLSMNVDQILYGKQ
ncbi:MAG: hypothetical protein AAB836_01525 [Patescibacteria group bacterium]